MSNQTTDPIQKLPSSAELRAHIGRLLRELRIARRLLRLTQSIEDNNSALDEIAAPKRPKGGSRG